MFHGKHSKLTVLGISFLLLSSPVFGQANPSKVYWGNQDSVVRANLDGTNTASLLILFGQQVRDLAIDSTSNKLYCLTTTNLYRMNLDGSALEPLGNLGGNYLALHPGIGKLFVANDADEIRRANLNGSGVETIFSPSGSTTGILGIAIDPVDSKLYFLESRFGGIPPSSSWRINRCNFDGTDLTIFTGLASGGIVPLYSYRGLEIDAQSRNFFYVSSFSIGSTTRTHSIVSRPLDLSDGTPIFQETVDIQSPVPNDLSLDPIAGKMFWSSGGVNSGSIRSVDLNGFNFLNLHSSNVGLKGIAIYNSLRLLGSAPANGSIDARQPSNVDGSNPTGISQIELQFNGSVTAIAPSDFSILQEGGAGSAPQITNFTLISDQSIRLHLTHAISPGAWTRFSHNPSGTFTRIGYLPADVNRDASSTPADILALIDSLNGVAVRPLESTDINRSGVAEPSDILRVIDLLNGAGAFEIWNGASLP